MQMSQTYREPNPTETENTKWTNLMSSLELLFWYNQGRSSFDFGLEIKPVCKLVVLIKVTVVPSAAALVI